MHNPLTILLYHGVSSESNIGIENYSGKHINTKIFENQISYISKNCNVLTMDEVVDIHNQGSEYPENAVAVTFDDGFRNNSTEAQPILEKYKVPAIFYVTSGIIGTNIMFWVDSLEDCINNSTVASITLELDSKRTFFFENNVQKLKALIEIKSYCKKTTIEEKNRIIKDLTEQTMWLPKVSSSKNYEKLRWDELKNLAASNLFTVGGHSFYHDVLTSFNDDKKLEIDIKKSIELLESNLSTSITHYAYPEGQKEHYNLKVIDTMRKYGIVCSPSAIHGINSGEYDLFNLRRIMVGINDVKFPFRI